MRNTVNLAVKGTRFYNAAELLQRGSLISGLTINLEHQPDNPYDKNAVAIRVKETGEMLGHVSRELAHKYASLSDDWKIIEASIARVERNGAYINIDVRVVYDAEESYEQLAAKHNSLLWSSISAMPEKSGVYAIRNIDTGRQYIGSSKNLKDRLRSHFRNLSIECHANHVLQSDFSHLGADHFEAKILVSCISPSSLTSVEAARITSLLTSGATLYNLTADGQGTMRNIGSHTDSKPISDRLVKQHTEAEPRQKDENLLEKRKAVIDTFDSKLASLLPQNNFWIYFFAIFICALILFVIIIQKINYFVLFILSGLFSFIFSKLTITIFKENAKKSPQYKNLVKQRDEKLAIIENDIKKPRDQ